MTCMKSINAAHVPPMYLTDDPSDGRTRESLHIVSIKLASIREDLRWPIDVFGMVTVRDVLDYDRKRNIIFSRARSNCETISEEVIYMCSYFTSCFLVFINLC
jgi:hypothetical protein